MTVEEQLIYCIWLPRVWTSGSLQLALGGIKLNATFVDCFSRSCPSFSQSRKCEGRQRNKLVHFHYSLKPADVGKRRLGESVALSSSSQSSVWVSKNMVNVHGI
jgi:hypothetical protein